MNTLIFTTFIQLSRRYLLASPGLLSTWQEPNLVKGHELVTKNDILLTPEKYWCDAWPYSEIEQPSLEESFKYWLCSETIECLSSEISEYIQV